MAVRRRTIAALRKWAWFVVLAGWFAVADNVKCRVLPKGLLAGLHPARVAGSPLQSAELGFRYIGGAVYGTNGCLQRKVGWRNVGERPLRIRAPPGISANDRPAAP
jgi:hypothetical protein